MRGQATQLDLVAFIGPSLPVEEALAIVPCTVMPPARQGDVWRAVSLRPAVIVLIDGVFEAQPSVWHREILAALDAGVAVFGGASMGALRAAELAEHGMVGVGRIFSWYRDGVIVDDAEVALLHAGPEHGHRPLTLPLVNVRYAARLAQAAKVLTGSEAEVLVEKAAQIFYQERTWPVVLDAVATHWRKATRARWDAWAAGGLEDLKQRDARECLSMAAEYAKAHAGSPTSVAPPSSAPQPSSWERRRRTREGSTVAGGRAVPSAAVLERLWRRPDAPRLAAQGLRRELLAGWARELGLRVSAGDVRRAERQWLAGLGISPEDRDDFLAASGLDERQAYQLCETLALEMLVLEHADRMLADGPSAEEGLALEGRLSGLWADEAEALPRGKRGGRGGRGGRG